MEKGDKKVPSWGWAFPLWPQVWLFNVGVAPKIGFGHFDHVGVTLRERPAAAALLDKIDSNDLRADEDRFGVRARDHQALLAE